MGGKIQWWDRAGRGISGTRQVLDSLVKRLSPRREGTGNNGEVEVSAPGRPHQEEG